MTNINVLLSTKMITDNGIFRFVLISCVLFSATMSTVHTDDARNKKNCPEQMFECSDGRCIPMSWLCDRDVDCINGEDESAEKCSSTECSRHEFACVNRAEMGTEGRLSDLFLTDTTFIRPNPKCIPGRWRCDGEYDCADSSDEHNCRDVTCSTNQFRCGNNTDVHAGQPVQNICIPLSWKCDNQVDCFDESDETDCANYRRNGNCSEDEFRCSNGECIFGQWLCDGDGDCRDRSDELNCSRTCSEQHFTCEKNKFCIPMKWRCDGEHDCIDGSDELHCTDAQLKPFRQVTCRQEQFACRNGGYCISQTWKCDYDKDCPDGSDEDDITCPNRQKNCGLNQLRCDDGECVEKTAFCDGKYDCVDESDEQKCKTSTKKCPEGTFSCADGSHCVEYRKLCDGRDDCATKQDENETVCAKNNLFCEEGSSHCQCRQAAHNSEARVCACEIGYVADSDKRVCVFYDACKTIGICSQICKSSETDIGITSGYKCSCHRGYFLQGDGKSCRAIGEDAKMLLVNRLTIRELDLVSKEYRPLISRLDSAVAMDYIHKENVIVWSDVTRQRIIKCKMDSNMHRISNVSECLKQEVLVSERITTPDGLAIDWVHDLLFWTDTGLNEISVLDLKNANNRRTLFNTDIDEPRAIAVDPSVGVIFWSDWGKKARIERASMDGTDRQRLVTGQRIKWPNGLALDFLDRRVYWADAKLKTIYSVDYWGTDLRTVLHSYQFVRHPFSLSVFEDRLFWTDWDHEGVLAVNKFHNGSGAETIVGGISAPMQVRIYHSVMQPPLENKCAGHDCPHLCLPASRLPAQRPVAQKLSSKTAVIEQAHVYSCMCRDGTLEHANQCLTVRVPTDTNWKTKNNDRKLKETSTEHHSQRSEGRRRDRHSTRIAFSTMLILFVISAALVAGAYMWYRRQSIPLRPINFDNPVYRRTVETADFDPSQSFYTYHNIDERGREGGLKLTLNVTDDRDFNPPSVDHAGHSRAFSHLTSDTQPLTQSMA